MEEEADARASGVCDRCLLVGCSGSFLDGSGDFDLGFFIRGGDLLFLTGDLEGFFLLSSVDSERFLRFLTTGDLEGLFLYAIVFLGGSTLLDLSLRFLNGDLERPLRSSIGDRERSLRFATGDLERSFR